MTVRHATPTDDTTDASTDRSIEARRGTADEAETSTNSPPAVKKCKKEEIPSEAMALVASLHSQYLRPDNVVTPVETGKSPLAMLTATCESIGHDQPRGKMAGKTSPKNRLADDRKNGSRPNSASNNGLAAMAVAGRCGFPGLAPGMPFGMPGFGGGMGAFPPHPYAAQMAAMYAGGNPLLASPMMPRICPDIACKGCPPPPMPNGPRICPIGCQCPSAVLAATPCPPSTPDPMLMMMAQQMMMNNMSPLMTPPSTSTALPSTAPQHAHHCDWMVGDKKCGKRFASGELLMAHVKTHTSMTPTTPKTSSPSTMPPPLPTPVASPRSMAAMRFHPYGKLPIAPPLLPMPFNAAGSINYAAAYQALMGAHAMPHP